MNAVEQDVTVQAVHPATGALLVAEPWVVGGSASVSLATVSRSLQPIHRLLPLLLWKTPLLLSMADHEHFHGGSGV